MVSEAQTVGAGSMVFGRWWHRASWQDMWWSKVLTIWWPGSRGREEGERDRK